MTVRLKNLGFDPSFSHEFRQKPGTLADSFVPGADARLTEKLKEFIKKSGAVRLNELLGCRHRFSFVMKNDAKG
jgi:hypothetical protein